LVVVLLAVEGVARFSVVFRVTSFGVKNCERDLLIRKRLFWIQK
jgi:hypothetical protein